jgi:hypothetical protein
MSKWSPRRLFVQAYRGFESQPLRQSLGVQLISALVEHDEKALLRQHFTDDAVDRVGGHPAQFLSRERISLWSC